MTELSHHDYWAKRDAVHDIVCKHFETGSDDGLPVGDAVMEALFGPPPPEPPPEYTHGALMMRVVNYTDVPIGVSTCEASTAVYLSPDEADAFALKLSQAATFARHKRHSEHRPNSAPGAEAVAASAPSEPTAPPNQTLPREEGR